MIISLGCTLVHAILAWLLVTGWPGAAGLGALGCGISNTVVGWCALIAGAAYMVRGQALVFYRLVQGWQWPQPGRDAGTVATRLADGLFQPCRDFVLHADRSFVAQLGATVVAGHRIVANLAALCYMLPLALAIAAMAQVGQAAGARVTGAAPG